MASNPTRLTGQMDELQGVAGIDGYGALVDAVLENVPDLLWPMSIRTYARMRHEPQIAAILKVYFMAVMRARWSINPDGCRDEVVQQISDDLGLPIKGVDPEPSGARRRKFVWQEHLRLALLDQVYGHMFFEQQWVEQAGFWRLETVQERMPQTVADIKLNPDGTLFGIEQDVLGFGVGSSKRPPITTANHALVYYVNEREGSNYFGRSLIRPSYGPWLIKDQVMRVHATSIRRFGLGLHDVEAPPGATPQQVLEAGRLAQTYRASDNAGVGLPPGFKHILTGMTGTVPDAVAFITYLDRLMTRSTLTSLLDMATAERGARSLGETVMDLMVYSQQDVANRKAATGTEQLVVPLVNANWGEDEPAPCIDASDVGADIELTAQDVNWLGAWWPQLPEPMQRYVLERYGISTDDLESATDPAASGGETDG